MENIYEEGFLEIVKPVIEHENFIKQKEFIQHGHTTVYDHVMKVAYLCYEYAKDKPGYHMNSLLRGALLHDYFLYDWHLPHGILHGPLHPRRAVRNAKRDFNINKKERNIILSHMFPLNFWIVPFSKEAWLVTRMDKRSYRCERKLFKIRKKELA